MRARRLAIAALFVLAGCPEGPAPAPVDAGPPAPKAPARKVEARLEARRLEARDRHAASQAVANRRQALGLARGRLLRRAEERAQDDRWPHLSARSTR
jgi:hypothetical protein